VYFFESRHRTIRKIPDAKKLGRLPLKVKYFTAILLVASVTLNIVSKTVDRHSTMHVRGGDDLWCLGMGY